MVTANGGTFYSYLVPTGKTTQPLSRELRLFATDSAVYWAAWTAYNDPGQTHGRWAPPPRRQCGISTRSKQRAQSEEALNAFERARFVQLLYQDLMGTIPA